MSIQKFNPEKLERLNNPERLKIFPVEQIVRFVDLHYPKKIIDLGAGTALFSREFSERFPRAEIFALDTSEIMVEWMKANIIHDFPLVQPKKIEEGVIPFDDDFVDFLFTINTYHEFRDRLKQLNECFRVLKPGGAIAISDWRKGETSGGPRDEVRFKPEDVEADLESIGFHSIGIIEKFPKNYSVIAFK